MNTAEVWPPYSPMDEGRVEAHFAYDEDEDEPEADEREDDQ